LELAFWASDITLDTLPTPVQSAESPQALPFDIATQSTTWINSFSRRPPALMSANHFIDAHEGFMATIIGLQPSR
jgi:hypothetical protein